MADNEQELEIKPKGGKKKLIIIIAAAVLLLGGGGGAAWFFLFSGDKEHKAENGEPEKTPEQLAAEKEAFMWRCPELSSSTRMDKPATDWCRSK